MADTKDTEPKPEGGKAGRTLSLKTGGGAGGRRGGGGAGGSSRPKVVVEKKRKRISVPTDGQPAAKRAAPKKPGGAPKVTLKPVVGKAADQKKATAKAAPTVSNKPIESVDHLTDSERSARAKALEQARIDEHSRAQETAEEERRREAEAAKRAVEEAADAKRRGEEDEARRKAEEEAARKLEDEARKQAEAKRKAEEEKSRQTDEARKAKQRGKVADPVKAQPEPEAEGDNRRKAPPTSFRVKESRKRPSETAAPAKGGDRRRSGKLTINQALNEDEGQRARSLASLKRRREREKRQLEKLRASNEKVAREVIIPEAITVQDLAARMAERGALVVKTLMDLGVMVTVNQTIDADTAELVAEELGHKVKRVSDADVEVGLEIDIKDDDVDLQPRAPVVTIMGHVDHGKTSLLDAFRNANVVAGEAGGITQHIGAYQVKDPNGNLITFLDTPGHAAFTQMRARGASVTDIVIIVVAANDSVMPQTVEAINHAKAAEVPIIVAVNKCDLPEANAAKTKQDLLQHEIYVEEMGGDIQSVDVSAKTGEGLDTLMEAISLQAEYLELKANPTSEASGSVIEAKLDKGRGPVATVLVGRGSLKKGDIFVAGAEWGRVRALVNDQGQQIKAAGPSQPVEVLGLQGAPEAGDEFIVVDNENRAREVSEFRTRKKREAQAAKLAGANKFETMFAQLSDDRAAEVPVIIKADVQGSVEAIIGALDGLGTDEVRALVLHGGVGGITQHDVSLAQASNALIIGFNVRANPQARDLAKAEGIELRYYSVIYDLVDEIKAAMSGMLSPDMQEEFIGRVDVREVFSVGKSNKVAGCLVTEGNARAKAKVRLLRDEVVVHEGEIDSLRRFKDEVKEVAAGTECGVSLLNYQDVKVGDVLELYDVKEVARTL
ncbi:MAG: translation initiation factor IF-2 [Alphaproteobacteria bacterium]